MRDNGKEAQTASNSADDKPDERLRPNCIVDISFEALSLLLGDQIEVFDIRVAQNDSWLGRLEVKSYRPDWGPVNEGEVYPHTDLIVSGDLPKVSFPQ